MDKVEFISLMNETYERQGLAPMNAQEGEAAWIEYQAEEEQASRWRD